MIICLNHARPYLECGCCSYCRGTGDEVIHLLTDPPKEKHVKCRRCNGTGKAAKEE